MGERDTEGHAREISARPKPETRELYRGSPYDDKLPENESGDRLALLAAFAQAVGNPCLHQANASWEMASAARDACSRKGPVGLDDLPATVCVTIDFRTVPTRGCFIAVAGFKVEAEYSRLANHLDARVDELELLCVDASSERLVVRCKGAQAIDPPVYEWVEVNDVVCR